MYFSTLKSFILNGLALFFLAVLAASCVGHRFNPAEVGVWYEFKEGDQLEKIAEQFDADAFAIRKRNEIYEPEDLAPGMLLFIPGVKTTPAAPSAAVRFPEMKDNDPVVQSGKRLIWPAGGTISSGYGRRHGRMHHGLDITKDGGLDIVAAGSGTVEFAGRMRGYGNVLIINHGRGIKTLYGHNKRNLVRQGQRVRQGQKIAILGSSGRSTGPHLHFEVRINDKARNPLRYLPFR
ncbi:MAG: peptidoglycan DD-metalloendopeptidase family protein [bacterium]|nr:peptidoglycan DD-metalloendopeptidase family protein [bacterium]